MYTWIIKKLLLAYAKVLEPVQHVVVKVGEFLEVTPNRTLRPALETEKLADFIARRGMEPKGSEVLCNGMVAQFLGRLGRGLVLVSTNRNVGSSFDQHANNRHVVVAGGPYYRGIWKHVLDIDIGLVLDEQHNKLCVTTDARPVQWGPPGHVLPIDWRSHQYESPGFCRISMQACKPKFLADLQSAFEVQSASHLRRAAVLTDPNS